MARGRFSVTRCTIAGVEAVSADTAHAFGRHIHDQFGIGVILRGAQTSLSGRGVVEAAAGDVITVNPGEVHDGAPLGEGGRAWQMLYFDPPVLAGAIRARTEGRAGGAELTHPMLHDPATAARFLSLFQAMTGAQGGESEIEADELLLLLLARLMEHRAPARPGGAPGAIARARGRIDDDPSAPLSLDELAVISGVSRFGLVRGFRAATGLTPHAYLVERRLQRARRLIAAGMPLVHAAQAAGFADQSHMTRLLARSYGLSPGRYAAGRG